MLSIALVLLFPQAAAEAPTLAGRWVAVSAQRDGKPAADIKGHVLRFEGQRFTITLKDRLLYEGAYTTDPAARPAAIDFVHTGGMAKGQTWKGIYELSGDRLKICDNAPDPKRPRPQELAGARGYVSVTFERMK